VRGDTVGFPARYSLFTGHGAYVTDAERFLDTHGTINESLSKGAINWFVHARTLGLNIYQWAAGGYSFRLRKVMEQGLGPEAVVMFTHSHKPCIWVFVSADVQKRTFVGRWPQGLRWSCNMLLEADVLLRLGAVRKIEEVAGKR
jgi:hypothetical protein